MRKDRDKPIEIHFYEKTKKTIDTEQIFSTIPKTRPPLAKPPACKVLLAEQKYESAFSARRFYIHIFRKPVSDETRIFLHSSTHFKQCKQCDDGDRLSGDFRRHLVYAHNTSTTCFLII